MFWSCRHNYLSLELCDQTGFTSLDYISLISGLVSIPLLLAQAYLARLDKVSSQNAYAQHILTLFHQSLARGRYSASSKNIDACSTVQGNCDRPPPGSSAICYLVSPRRSTCVVLTEPAKFSSISVEHAYDHETAPRPKPGSALHYIASTHTLPNLT